MILPDCVPMAGRQVLFVMAARPEYGPHLARRAGDSPAVSPAVRRQGLRRFRQPV